MHNRYMIDSLAKTLMVVWIVAASMFMSATVIPGSTGRAVAMQAAEQIAKNADVSDHHHSTEASADPVTRSNVDVQSDCDKSGRGSHDMGGGSDCCATACFTFVVAVSSYSDFARGEPAFGHAIADDGNPSSRTSDLRPPRA